MASPCPSDLSAAASCARGGEPVWALCETAGNQGLSARELSGGDGQRRGFLADDAPAVSTVGREKPACLSPPSRRSTGRDRSERKSTDGPTPVRAMACSPPSREPPLERLGVRKAGPGFRLQTPSPRATRQQTDGQAEIEDLAPSVRCEHDVRASGRGPPFACAAASPSATRRAIVGASLSGAARRPRAAPAGASVPSTHLARSRRPRRCLRRRNRDDGRMIEDRPPGPPARNGGGGRHPSSRLGEITFRATSRPSRGRGPGRPLPSRRPRGGHDRHDRAGLWAEAP